jgi:hypothetical protein
MNKLRIINLSIYFRDNRTAGFPTGLILKAFQVRKANVFHGFLLDYFQDSLSTEKL